VTTCSTGALAQLNCNERASSINPYRAHLCAAEVFSKDVISFSFKTASYSTRCSEVFVAGGYHAVPFFSFEAASFDHIRDLPDQVVVHCGVLHVGGDSLLGLNYLNLELGLDRAKLFMRVAQPPRLQPEQRYHDSASDQRGAHSGAFLFGIIQPASTEMPPVSAASRPTGAVAISSGM
jgi:hypothetical protein